MNIVERIHPSIAIHTQASGRHSTTGHPQKDGGFPLAQLPSRLHDIFIPDKGEFWFGGDFSGQEVWIISAEANDLPTLDALKAGYDSHTLALCDGMGWPYPNNKFKPKEDRKWLQQIGIEETFGKWRKWFKSCRLALNYGKRKEYLYKVPGSATLGITQTKGIDIAERYLEKHPALVQYWERLGRHIEKTSTVTSFTGRRRMLHARGDAKRREGFNGPMQQGGADILNLTIVRVCSAFRVARYKYGVHDSFWFSFPMSYFERMNEILKTINQPFIINGHSLNIPIEYKEIRVGV